MRVTYQLQTAETLSRDRNMKAYITASVLALLTASILGFTAGNQTLFIFLNSGALNSEGFWASITFMGDTLPLLLCIGLLAWNRPQLLWTGFLATLTVGIGIQFAKYLFALPRPAAVLAPEFIHIIGPTLKTRAFPSGHTAAAFAIAALFASETKFWQSKTVLITLAAVIGLSRIMVGAHWPTDVIVGAWSGWTLGIAAVYLSKYWPWGFCARSGRVFSAGFYSIALMLCAGHTGGYDSAIWLSDTLIVLGSMVILPYFIHTLGIRLPTLYYFIGERIQSIIKSHDIWGKA